MDSLRNICFLLRIKDFRDGAHFRCRENSATKPPMIYKVSLVSVFGAFLLLSPAPAAPQSLGEIARQLRAESKAQSKQTIKVYTNDDIPHASSVEATGPSSTTEAPSSSTPQSAAAGSSSAASAAAGLKQSPEAKSKPSQKQSAKNGQSEDYWQSQIMTARNVLARAKQEQQLVEDELSLLEIQKARELNPNRSKDLGSRIETKKDDVEAKRTATEAAQKSLETLESEYKKWQSSADKN